MAVAMTEHQNLRELVGRNIRFARVSAELTQDQLADQLDTTRFKVSDWERGIHEPNRVTLMRIGGIVGRTLGWFYDPHLDAEL